MAAPATAPPTAPPTPSTSARATTPSSPSPSTGRGPGRPVAFGGAGPACPPRSSVLCIGSQGTNSCSHTTVTGLGVGRCDVLVQFNPYTDGRPSEIVQLQFGPPYSAPGTCCKGYQVLGPSTYIIPDHPNGGSIYGTVDGGDRQYDAIFIIRDASADANDSGARDAGSDAPSGN